MEAINVFLAFLVLVCVAVVVLERQQHRKEVQRLLDRQMAKDLRDLSDHALTREAPGLDELDRKELEALRLFKAHVEEGVPIS
jgi:hypothetical protein